MWVEGGLEFNVKIEWRMDLRESWQNDKTPAKTLLLSRSEYLWVLDLFIGFFRWRIFTKIFGWKISDAELNDLLLLTKKNAIKRSLMFLQSKTIILFCKFKVMQLIYLFLSILWRLEHPSQSWTPFAVLNILCSLEHPWRSWTPFWRLEHPLTTWTPFGVLNVLNTLCSLEHPLTTWTPFAFLNALWHLEHFLWTWTPFAILNTLCSLNGPSIASFSLNSLDLQLKSLKTFLNL
jgi:hypothetical protein